MENMAMELYKVKFTAADAGASDGRLHMTANILAESDDKKAIKKVLKEYFEYAGLPYCHIRVKKVKPLEIDGSTVLGMRRGRHPVDSTAATEEQAPMKPNIHPVKTFNGDVAMTLFSCPVCKKDLDSECEPNYCPNCGQRMDWT
jgi:hypothetical protein